MIELTRLNGSPLFVNCDLIKWAEAAPDTVLTLVNGEKLVVRESCLEVVARLQRQRLIMLIDLIQLIPEPEAFLRAAAAARVPGPWSRAATEGAHESSLESGHEGGDSRMNDSEEDAERG